MEENRQKKKLTEESLPRNEVQKLTALWAMSESSVGGILHALKIPFRGMFISTIAIILISMLAQFARRPFQIIKSTISVIMIKAMISPHTPLAAHLSVFLQGTFGQLYFSIKGFRLLSALLLGTTVALLNSFQKIIMLTIIYGQNLWQTIDDFFAFVNQEWINDAFGEDISLSYWLISVFIAIHLLIGILAGLLAYHIPKKVEKKMNDPIVISDFESYLKPPPPKQKKKKRWLKPSMWFVVIFALAALILSYLYPSKGTFDVSGIIIMLIRSFLILFVWFFILAPLVKKYLIRLFNKKRKNEYANEIDAILTRLPDLKITVSAAWAMSSKKKGLNRIFYFGTLSLACILRKT